MCCKSNYEFVVLSNNFHKAFWNTNSTSNEGVGSVIGVYWYTILAILNVKNYSSAYRTSITRKVYIPSIYFFWKQTDEIMLISTLAFHCGKCILWRSNRWFHDKNVRFVIWLLSTFCIKCESRSLWFGSNPHWIRECPWSSATRRFWFSGRNKKNAEIREAIMWEKVCGENLCEANMRRNNGRNPYSRHWL